MKKRRLPLLKESNAYDLLFNRLLSAASADEIKTIFIQSKELVQDHVKILSICMYILHKKELYKQSGFTSFTAFVETEWETSKSSASELRRIGTIIVNSYFDKSPWDYTRLKKLLSDPSFSSHKLLYFPEAWENHSHEEEDLWHSLKTLSEKEFRKYANKNPLIKPENALPPFLDESAYQAFRQTVEKSDTDLEVFDRVYTYSEPEQIYILDTESMDVVEKRDIANVLSDSDLILRRSKMNLPTHLTHTVYSRLLKHGTDKQNDLISHAYEYSPEKENYQYNILTTKSMAIELSTLMYNSGIKGNTVNQLSPIFPSNSIVSIDKRPLLKNTTCLYS